jgi:hypothetical protein
LAPHGFAARQKKGDYRFALRPLTPGGGRQVVLWHLRWRDGRSAKRATSILPEGRWDGN